jgi:hypothetical protein
MKDSEIINNIYKFISDNIFELSLILICIFSIHLMFFWENKVRWWLRLPIINLLLFTILIIGGTVEEIYLTFHPKERTKYIKTSIFQRFF